MARNSTGNKSLGASPKCHQLIVFHFIGIASRIERTFDTMVFKCFLVFCGAMALAGAAVVPVAPAVLAKIEDFDAVPRYSFAYDVQDAATGDSKAQYESRDGDVVQGSYSLIEADGTRRIVDYTADSVNGFNAVVSREPAVAVAPVVAKTAIAAPVVAPAVPARVVAPAVSAPIVGAPASIVSPVLPAAPLAYTIPRAVATRLAAPAVYGSPYAAYALRPNYL